jgi:hypothetical protein
VKKVHLALGDDCNVVLEFVDHIEPSASGKYRFTISKVREPDQTPRGGTSRLIADSEDAS